MGEWLRTAGCATENRDPCGNGRKARREARASGKSSVGSCCVIAVCTSVVLSSSGTGPWVGHVPVARSKRDPVHMAYHTRAIYRDTPISVYTRVAVGTITILGFSLAEIAGMFDQPTDAADVHSALKFRTDIYTIGSIYTRDAVNNHGTLLWKTLFLLESSTHSNVQEESSQGRAELFHIDPTRAATGYTCHAVLRLGNLSGASGREDPLHDVWPATTVGRCGRSWL